MIFSPNPPAEHCKILVVCSGNDRAEFFSNTLSSAGYVSIRSRNVQEAVEIALSERPDGIIVHFPLEGCVGKEAELEACFAFSSVARPVFCTGSASEVERAISGFEAHFSDFLPEPLKGDTVLAKLRYHLAMEQDRKERDGRVESLAATSLSADKSVGGALHDVSNLLLSIRGLSEMLMEGPACRNDAETNQLAAAILSAAKNGLQRVDAALDATDTEEMSTLSRGQHCVEEFLEEAIGNLSGWAKRKQMELRISVEPGLEIYCDRERLIRAVENLLSNALKYSQSGTVVEVEAKIKEDVLTIAVRDEGPGVVVSRSQQVLRTPERQAVNPFWGESSHGLGLSICQEIAMAHHGRIECRKLSPRGSEFVISLPVGKDAA